MTPIADFSQFLNAAKEADLAPKKPLRLGALTDALRTVPLEAIIVIEVGDDSYPWNFGDVGSYRGYYSDLAIEPAVDAMRVGEALETLEQANGETFQGYKGGDYTMDDDTMVWASSYSTCSGLLVTGVENRDGLVVITTTPEEN